MSAWLGKLVTTLVLVLLALLLFARLGPGIPVHSVVTQKNDLFTVSGEGKVAVVPDTAIVDLGITANRPSVKAAQTEANTAINNITNAVKGLGVDNKDIKTSNYSVYPQYDFREGTNRINGYQVNVSVTIRVRDIEKVNQVVDAATSNGANTIGGIRLTVDEEKQKELLQDARQQAVNEAKEKAQSLAQAAGISLGKIVNVIETPQSVGPFPLDLKAEVSNGVGAGGSTDVQLGTTDITTSVTLFYETR